MRRTLTDSEALGTCGGIIATLLLAGVLGGVRPAVEQANAVLLLVLVVIGAAYVGGRVAGVATALAAAVSFDFFLTEPYRSLAIKHPGNVLATVLLAIVGLAVGGIARGRTDARDRATTAGDEIASVHRVTRAAAGGADVHRLVASVEDEVAKALRLAECRFEALPPSPPVPVLEATGRVDAPYVHLGDGFALPPEGVAIEVRAEGGTLGWLVGRPPSHPTGVSLDRRRAALILADHLGQALARVA